MINGDEARYGTEGSGGVSFHGADGGREHDRDRRCDRQKKEREPALRAASDTLL